MLRMPDGNTTVIMQGKRRFTLGTEVQKDPYLKATITAFPDVKPKKDDKEFSAVISSVKDMALRIIQNNPQIPQEAQMAIKNIDSHGFLLNFISSNLNAESPGEAKYSGNR